VLPARNDDVDRGRALLAHLAARGPLDPTSIEARVRCFAIDLATARTLRVVPTLVFLALGLVLNLVPMDAASGRIALGDVRDSRLRVQVRAVLLVRVVTGHVGLLCWFG
jgi:hypothetical protein